MHSFITEGLIYSIMILGVFMSYRVLNFCDMSVDGAFPMGAAIFAACIQAGIAPGIGLLLAFTGGLFAGGFTTFIYTFLNIPDLLAGILTMTMLWSVNLRIMGQASINFDNEPTTFSAIKDSAAAFFKAHPIEALKDFPVEDWAVILFLVIFVGLLIFVMFRFFNTDFGLTMGALGSNPQMVISQGMNPVYVRAAGICIGDGLAALSGAFLAMDHGSSHVSMGTGVIMNGLAALMLGELIIHSNKISWQLIRVVIGAILYWAITYYARTYGYIIGMKTDDLKFINGLIIIICLAVSRPDFQVWIKKHLTRTNDSQSAGGK